MNRSIATFATLLLALGCADPAAVTPGPTPDTPTPVDIDRDPIAPADLPDARRVRRMTAEQFNASLEVATGQRWADYEQHADTLGRPDFAQVTEEGEQLSVAFERLVGEAARATCRDAIRAERAEGASAPRALLGELTLGSSDSAARLANLRRLLLRFHGHEITADDDPRVLPWLALLDAPLSAADVGGRGATDADIEAMRWEAICIGLTTHADFLTY